jgi:signal transduction histidine kinase
MGYNVFMKWPHATTWACLVAAWAALAAWQYHEYCHEVETARETLRRPAQAVMDLLVGGIRSHRRLGPFFDEQIRGLLGVLEKAEDVRAAALVTLKGELLLSTGRTDLLDLSGPLEPGETLNEAGFRLVARFGLPSELGGPGGGRGAGRGWARGMRPPLEEGKSSLFEPGSDCTAVLLLARTRADDHLRRAALTRGMIVAAGGLVLFCVVLVWGTTVRLAAARGALQAESKHLQELSQAAAGLAHETRNPLGLIRGWTQRLAESVLGSPEQSQQAQAIVEECDRVTARLNQFLTFARPAQVKVEAVDLPPLLEELAGLMESDLEARRLTLQRKVAPESTHLQADREMLRQILFNLVQNAVQWSPEGGTVEMDIRSGYHDRHRIEIADRGPGVPAESLPRLFTPYFTTRPDGTGLGLAIVRRLATANGWEVGYTPRPGGGALFWLDGIYG